MGLGFAGGAVSGPLNFAASDFGRFRLRDTFELRCFSLLPISIYFSSINLRVTRSIEFSSSILLYVRRCAWKSVHG